MVVLGDLDWSEAGEWPSLQVSAHTVTIHPDYNKVQYK